MTSMEATCSFSCVQYSTLITTVTYIPVHTYIHTCILCTCTQLKRSFKWSKLIFNLQLLMFSAQTFYPCTQMVNQLGTAVSLSGFDTPQKKSVVMTV